MISFIIIDDERLSCEELALMIDYESLGLKCAGTFYNSKKALDFIDNNDVDLILCDIKMPGISGLEIVEYCNNVCPETKIILISAFREFEYAQSAVKYQNVIDYLTKPLDYDHFVEVISRVAENLSIERNTNGFAEANTKTLYFQQFYSDYSIGITNSSTFQASLNKHNINIDIYNNPIAILNIHINNMFDYLSDTWKYSQERLNDAITHVVQFEDDSLYTYVASYSFYDIKVIAIEKNSSYDKKTLADCIAYMKTQLLECLNIDAEIRVINIFDSIHKMRKSSTNADIISNQISEILSCLLEHDYEKCKIICEQVFKTSNAEYIKQFLTSLRQSLKIYVNPQLLPTIPRTTDLITLNDYIVKVIDAFRKDTISHDKYMPVKQAIMYMQNRFNEDISLETTAHHVALSPKYLGLLFKQYTGMNFIDNLVSLRIDKAREILHEQPNIKTAVLCEMVGYKSIPYFYKVFLKQTGMSLSDYRKNYLQSH